MNQRTRTKRTPRTAGTKLTASRSAEPLLRQLRKQLRPTRSADKIVSQFVCALQKKIPQAIIMAGGSYAKGTFIKGSHDVDIFARFPKGTPDEKMSASLIKALPRAQVLHGSRDYLQIKFRGFDFEIVPVNHIAQWREATNVTDMSPLHVQYVAKHLNESQKDDVRLTKLFMKACGVYGAESHVRGFSGYVTELLIQMYGSFEKLLLASEHWKEGMLLDPEKHYKSDGDARRRLNEAKLLSPLIIVDPLQPDRNAAAALSMECFEDFRDAAAQFKKKPSKVFFDPRISPAKIKRKWKGAHVLFTKVKTPKGKKDIVGAKLRVKHDRTLAWLREYEFEVIHSAFRFGEKQTIAWYVLKQVKLSPKAIREGPPSSLSAAVKSFCAVHPTAYESQGRWYVEIKRRYTDAKRVISAAWKNKR